MMTWTKSKGVSSGALVQIKTDSEPQNGGTPGGSPTKISRFYGQENVVITGVNSSALGLREMAMRRDGVKLFLLF